MARVARAAAGHQREAAGARRVDAAAVLALLLRVEMALHFGVEPLGAEVAGEHGKLLRRPAAERDQAAPQIGELRRRDAAFFLSRRGVAQGQEAAEVPVAAAVLAQERD